MRRVIDGDTVQLSDGQLVRYLGINAPEVRRRVAGCWIVEPEPFGLEATAAKQQLVEHQRVRLEYDARTRDRFGRLLAYVYVMDGMMINTELLRRGFARPMIIPPNVRYAEQFRALTEDARQARRGMWAGR